VGNVDGHTSLTVIESLVADPPTAFTWNANSALLPAVTVCEALPPDGITISKSIPVPNRLMLCGLSPALSFSVSDAVRDPPAVGRNVTLIVHVPAGNTVELHVVVCEKSPLFVPVNIIVLMFSVSLPPLVTVTTCAALVVATACVANVSFVGVIVAVAPVPNPNNVPVCGLPGASSAIDTMAELEPVVLGVNVTVITHEFPEVSAAPHVFTCEKLELLAPVIVKLVMFNVTV
jgi:hypothetical protein